LPEKWHRGKAAFDKNPHGDEEFIIHGDCGTKQTYCPYGRVGDRLWVQEAHRIVKIKDRDTFCVQVQYSVDNEISDICLENLEYWKFGERKYPYRKTSGRFMYKSLSRITLEITNIRVERLRDISLEDIAAEGIADLGGGAQAVIDCFINEVWDPINEKRGYGWNENPFVWVIEFKRISDKGR